MALPHLGEGGESVTHVVDGIERAHHDIALSMEATHKMKMILLAR